MAADAAGSDAPTTDTVTPVDDASSTDAAPAMCALPQVYIYSAEGGHVSYRDVTTLSPPRNYTRERMHFDTMSERCSVEIPACGGGDAVSVDDVAAALTHPDVVAAFDRPDSPMVIYGHDNRPADGQILRVRRSSGGEILVGDPCNGRSGCREIPAGVGSLVALLRGLDMQQIAQPACRNLQP